MSPHCQRHQIDQIGSQRFAESTVEEVLLGGPEEEHFFRTPKKTRLEKLLTEASVNTRRSRY